MKDNEKTKEQLIQDLTELRLQNTEMKQSPAGSKPAELAAGEDLQYAESIVETVRESLLVLDADLKIISANSNFYKTFKVTPGETIGSFIYDLGNRQWDIPALRELLETILPDRTTFDGYEVEHNFKSIGRRVMLLNARQIKRVLGKESIILLAIEDITERRDIEDGLEKTRKELAVIKTAADEASEFAGNLINTVREPLIALDQDLRVVTASRSFYEFFKVNSVETIGQLIYDLGDRQWDIPALRELLETILPDKTTFDSYEVEHDFKSIGRRVMLLNARQIKRAFGKERIILLAIEDITERKRIESMVIDSEDRFRRLFETANDGIVLLEKNEGKIALINPAAEKMLGKTKKDSIGHRLQDIGISLDMNDFQTTLQELNKRGILNYYDVPVKTKSGNFIYTDIYLVDKTKLVQCNIRDITEQKMTTEKLMKSESNMRMLISKNIDGLIIVDAEGILQFMNPAAENLFGQTSKKLTGKHMGLPPISSGAEEMEIFGEDGAQRTAEMRTVAINWEEKEAFLISLRDVTEQKNTGEKLNQLAYIVKSSEDAIISKTLDGIITSWNKGAEKIYGYKEKEVLGKSIKLLLQPGHEDDSNLILEKVRSGEHIKQIGAVRVRKDGHEIFMSLTISPVLNSECQIIAISTVGHEITERLHAEEKLKFQAHLLSMVGQAVIATDQNGIINYWNKAATELYGWSEEEVIGKNIMNVTVSQQTKDQAEEIINSLLSGKSWSGEFFVQRKDGLLFPMHVSNSPVFDDAGNLKGIIGISFDITDRMLSEDALRKSEEKFRSIMENSADAIFIADQNGKYTYTNKAVTDMLGFTDDEMKNKTVIDLVPKERINEFLELFKTVLTTGKGIGELELLKNDGNYLPVDLNSIILPDGMVYGSCRDISERIKSKKELESHRDNLEELVRERTAELKIAKEKAEEANMAKSRFLANMSHEIRTPMNAVLGFSQLMLRDPHISDRQKERLNTINRSGENLLALLNDILEISKIEAGKITLHKSVFDLYMLLDDVVNIFQIKAEERKLNFIMEISNDTPQFINTDEIKLRQILINLVGNAVKFTKTGGICIRTKITKNEKLFLVVDVEDTGMGISKKDIARLFKVFEQTTEGSRMGGTGLGLTLSRYFARQLGGDIYVRSEENKGSTFSLKINITLAENSDLIQTAAKKHVIGLKPGQKEFKVLVVDDQIENRKLLSELLHEIGLFVIEASDGLESIDKIKENQPDLIFMDINMPVMGGLDAIKQIRHLDINNNVPVIAVTASVFEEDKQIILQSGFNGFVKKPFRDFEIFEIVESVLGIEYLYREEQSENKYTIQEIEQFLMKLPEDLVKQIIDFATKADIKSLHILVNEASQIIPEIGPYLQKIVKEYKYDVLIQLLQNRRDTDE